MGSCSVEKDGGAGGGDWWGHPMGGGGISWLGDPVGGRREQVVFPYSTLTLSRRPSGYVPTIRCCWSE